MVTLLHCLRWPLLSIILPRLCLIAFTFCQPFLITRAIDYVSETGNNATRNDGYGLIAATALVYSGLAVGVNSTRIILGCTNIGI